MLEGGGGACREGRPPPWKRCPPAQTSSDIFLFTFSEHGVDLYDHALAGGSRKKIWCQSRAIVGVLDAVRVEVALEGVDVIGAEGDVSRADADRVDGLTAAEGDAEVSRSEVHLHVAVRAFVAWRLCPVGHFETFAKNASYMGGLREGWD